MMGRCGCWRGSKDRGESGDGLVLRGGEWEIRVGLG
jgi:hypothetical protein